jgi:hypothetical protein
MSGWDKWVLQQWYKLRTTGCSYDTAGLGPLWFLVKRRDRIEQRREELINGASVVHVRVVRGQLRVHNNLEE